MLGSNFALLVKSPGDDGQQQLTTVSRLGMYIVDLYLNVAVTVSSIVCPVLFFRVNHCSQFLSSVICLFHHLRVCAMENGTLCYNMPYFLM